MILFVLCCVLLWTVFHSTSAQENSPHVKISKGWLVGKSFENANVFLGIPFAKPPINELRFQRPVTPDPWNYHLETQKYAARCPQQTDELYSEDCLYLNVFVPKFQINNKQLAVYVHVNGGGFMYSNGNLPLKAIISNFVSEEIIFVSFNYRASAFGFFTTRTEHFPPNVGLYDLLMVLEWVQQEIVHFGGDPSKVTLGGHSAGAAMASVLSYSPKAKGLFRGVIASSGTASNSWTVDGTYGGRELTGRCTPSNREFAIQSGCITKRDWDMCEFENLSTCLRKKPLEALMKSLKVRLTNQIFMLPERSMVLLHMYSTAHAQSTPEPFRLVIDGADGLIPTLFEDRSHLPGLKYLIGSNHDERADDYFELRKAKNKDHSVNAFDSEDHFDASIKLGVNIFGFGVLHEEVFGMAKKLYVVNRTHHGVLPWIQAAVEFRSDYWINSGVAKEVMKLVEEDSPVYLYSMDHKDPSVSPHSSIRAVSHSRIMEYVFYKSKGDCLDTSYNEEFEYISTFINRAWTNFIKTGNPNFPLGTGITWDQVSSKGLINYLSIDKQLSMKDGFHAKANLLFNVLVPELVETRALVFSPLCNRGNSTYLSDLNFLLKQQRKEAQSSDLFALLVVYLSLCLVCFLGIAWLISHTSRRGSNKTICSLFCLRY